MAIKPGIGRKSSNKNPPILSSEFFIQNHADIISCFAMIFVVGLMDETTSPLATAFISMHHNVTGVDPSRENPTGKPYTYIAGIKDYCAIIFYTMTCIICHAIIQEFLLDKISKKLHLSKFKLSLFNESGQLVAFYLISFFWGAHVALREGYLRNISLLWDGFPNHPMIFLHKFFFIIQLSYYLHMLPELYFQKVKKEDQQPRIIHSICGFSLIGLAYLFGFQRIGILLITLHYLSEIITHTFQLIAVFDREEKFASVHIVNNVIFVFVRFATMVIGVLTLYYGVANTDSKLRAFLALIGLMILQGYLIYSFITEQLRANREAKREVKQAQTKKAKTPKEKTRRKKESDLPEADQSPSPMKPKIK